MAVLRFFGPLEDVVGVREATMDPHLPVTARALGEAIRDAYPTLDGVRYSLAVDGAFVEGEALVEAAGEIALLPPFAGG